MHSLDGPYLDGPAAAEARSSALWKLRWAVGTFREFILGSRQTGACKQDLNRELLRPPQITWRAMRHLGETKRNWTLLHTAHGPAFVMQCPRTCLQPLYLHAYRY